MKKVSYYYDSVYPEKCVVELDEKTFEELRKEVLEALDEESCIATREGEYGKYMSCDLSITATPQSNVAYCTTVQKYLNPFLEEVVEANDNE